MPRQTGTTERAYKARRRAIMHPGPAGIGVTRKIQLARMSIGKEKTMRIPTTPGIMITMVEHSGPRPSACAKPSPVSSAFLKKIAQANAMPR